EVELGLDGRLGGALAEGFAVQPAPEFGVQPRPLPAGFGAAPDLLGDVHPGTGPGPQFGPEGDPRQAVRRWPFHRGWQKARGGPGEAGRGGGAGGGVGGGGGPDDGGAVGVGRRRGGGGAGPPPAGTGGKGGGGGVDRVSAAKAPSPPAPLPRSGGEGSLPGQ